MKVRTITSQPTTLTFSNEAEDYKSFKVQPTGGDVSIDFGNRTTSFILENTSARYMLGEIKPTGIAKFDPLGNGYWCKIDIRAGNKIEYHNYQNEAPYNAGAVAQELLQDGLKDVDIVFVLNQSGRADHAFNLNVRPTRNGQTLFITNSSASTQNIRVNLGNPTVVEGHLIHEGVVDGGAGAKNAEMVLITDDKYVSMGVGKYLNLRGVRRPTSSTDVSYYWVVEDGTTLKLN
jgi:hypothetical protein